jgi:hypothetical protein
MRWTQLYRSALGASEWPSERHAYTYMYEYTLQGEESSGCHTLLGA